MVIILLLNVERCTYNILTIKFKYYYAGEKKMDFKYKLLFVEFSGFVGGFGCSFVEKEDQETRLVFFLFIFSG